MSVTAVDTQQLRADAEAALAEARTRRERLSLDALAGVEQAAEELAQVETEIAELERTIALASLATAERARRDRVAEEETARQERAQAAREAQTAAVERQRRLHTVQLQLGTLANAVGAFLESEHTLQDCSVRAAQPFRPLAPSVSLLAVISLVDAGLPNNDDTFGWVPAATRRRLLDAFPLAEAEIDESGPAETVPTTRSQCAVCAHAGRDKVEAELAAGATLRDLEQRYGLSRSSLSRHRQHTTPTTQA